MLHGLLGEAFLRRVACFGATSRILTLRGGAEIPQRPLASLSELPAAPSLVLHLAFQTKGVMTLPAGEFTNANRAISNQVHTALDRIGAEAIFLASSGAAYLADSAETSPFKRLYGSLKLEDERKFGAWAEVNGKTSVIARVFNLSGPYINNRSHYALACFIADVLANRPIDIRATNRVYRSYTSIEEVMSVVFGALTGPDEMAYAFDTAGEATHEVGEIAEAVALALGHRFGIQRPPLRLGEPEDRYAGDGGAFHILRRELGVPLIDLTGQIKQTARFMAGHPE
jgi:nucleoside-diphosphate-sugar epimerase